MNGSLMQNPGQRLERGRLRSSPVASRSPRTVGGGGGRQGWDAPGRRAYRAPAMPHYPTV